MTNNLKAYTLVPDQPNMTYLAQTKNVPVMGEPLSGSTMGLMMLLSTLQYQAPYMNPTYSSAAQQAGKAAYTQSGGQALQDKLQAKATSEATSFARSLGIADGEAGVVLGSAKIIRDRQINLNGPNLFFIKTHLTVGEDHGSIGLGVKF